jgi:hypothetical protein
MKNEDELIIDLTTEPSPPADILQHCPICGLAVPTAELAAHANAHFVEEEELEAEHHDLPLLSQHEQVPVACPLCGEMLSLEDIDSHALAHTIEQNELDGHSIADDLYYEELRQTYGFAAKKRTTGKCFICGEAGHWVPECPKNPDNIVAQARIIPQPTASTVTAAQKPDPQFKNHHRYPLLDPRALLQLLGQCTTKQTIPKEFSRCKTLLSGTVSHFGGQRVDSGWGCGYRNIQMLAAHLLATDEPAAQSLFSGSRFVPDIPSLQAWIEVAWRAGFDSVGAEQLGRQLQGGKKWIGTTEAAVLFRYFGIPTVIIDFGNTNTAPSHAQSGGGGGGGGVHGGSGVNENQLHQMKITSFTSKAPPSTTATATEEGNSDKDESVEVHEGVECDVCGCFPIQNERYKSQVIPNYDVCGQCIENNSEITAAAGPFTRVPAPPRGNNSQNLGVKRFRETPSSTADANEDAGAPLGGFVGGKAGHGKNAARSGNKKYCSPAGERLLQWVWEYFSQVDVNAIEMNNSGQPGCEGDPPSTSTTTAAAGPSAAVAGGSSPTPLNINLSRGGPGWKVETKYTCRCPLYLQHEGHSRTIIGVERKEKRDGTFEITLLMLDPGVPPPALHDALKAGIKWQRLIKRSAATLNKPQYQLMFCPNGAVPLPPGSTQYEALKVLAAQEKL